MEQKNIWVLKSFEDAASFKGNEGYDDEPELCYAYDSTVINHGRLAIGDYIIIVDKRHVKGLAIIERIESSPGILKKQYACPECGTKRHKSRIKAQPKFRCVNGHEFDLPVESARQVDQYRAHYSQTYQRIEKSIPARIINEFYVKYNSYYSIQPARTELLEAHFSDLVPLSTLAFSLSPASIYNPSIEDSRAYRLLKSAVRPEQTKFRQSLSEIYGLSCMVSGCEISEVIDASHICPYRGLADNHLTNGILLRKDLHALFDADLLAIEPDTLKIHISPLLRNTIYEEYHGFLLRLGNRRFELSQPALSLRWKVFNECADGLQASFG